MIRKFLVLVVLIGLTACAAPVEVPATDCPREGGIGGTGECSQKSAAS